MAVINMTRGYVQRAASRGSGFHWTSTDSNEVAEGMVSCGGLESDLTAGGGDGELVGGVSVSMTAGRESGMGDGGMVSGEFTLGGEGSIVVLERVRLRGPCGVVLGRRRWAREGSSKSSAMLGPICPAQLIDGSR